MSAATQLLWCTGLGMLCCGQARAQCNEQVLFSSLSAPQDGFGRRVAVNRDTVAVALHGHFGQSGAEGAVTIFERAGVGWSEAQSLTSPNPVINQVFGWEIAISQDLLLVRESRQDLTLFPEGGPAVQVYSRRAGQWVWQQKLDAPVPGAPTLLHFGNDIAVDGGTIYVGDTWRDLIHVYERTSASWVEVAPITTADLHPLPIPSSFPRNFVVQGDRLMVAVENGSSFQVYVLDRDAGGWHGSAILDPGGQNIQLEPDLDFEDDLAFIGSEAENGQAGKVYVYRYSSGMWSLTQVIVPEPWFTLTRFGHRLEYEQGVLAVGAPGWDLPMQNTGRVYLFEEDGLRWVQSAAIDTTQPVQNLTMGYDIALSGELLVSGSPAESTSLGGRAFAFDLERAIGTVYGESGTNSTGLGARLFALGSTRIEANCIEFSATNLPVGQTGYLLMARPQGFVPLFGGSQGNLHLSLPIVRFSADVLSIGASGSVDFSPDLSSLPQGAVVQPGDTWSFQLWFRDVNPQPTSNTTNGLAVTFATDDDPSVQFPVSLGSTEENNSQITCRVTLSQPTDQDVVVPYTIDGTATYDVDWRVEEPSPIVIPGGRLFFDITITVNEDVVQEGDETAIVTLVNPTGGVLGSATSFTLTIRDDD
ncbi:MAG: PQQ-binding-like beta-propeller repeat protein [bacterium]|nr:PQQ-binding-like beta-propeller repeat protein [bacterium]